MVHEENRSLLQMLGKCSMECNHCFSACLEERDLKLLKDCIRLNVDCATICQLTAGFIGRGSDHAEHLLRECTEICNACAAECEKHAHMEHCRLCAETCRACAELCSHGMMV